MIGPRGFERISIGGRGRLDCKESGTLLTVAEDDFGRVGRYENKRPFTRSPVIVDVVGSVILPDL